MKKSRFRESRIVSILKEAEAGVALEEVRHIAETWIEECNAVRPHEALQGFAPYQFAAQYA